ncbi:4-hydroxyphenylpyruvate dioxygenase [Hibiscus syriacus]|uniref:4-hydroxyphenylpyruvate dioxygenase n=1 Tax=Hibiscus syriacus TaxID=106335 RepID=A0A6A3AYM9_HIBSY|nr:4-hydroxyphenylpyruvate dioxygenase [Hibiscus syriacus]
MVQSNSTDDFKLVGFSKFVRSNPKSDRFAVKRFHHIEFWCTDATNTARRFSWGLGMQSVAKSDVKLYGDVVLRYISYNKNTNSHPDSFLPGFEKVEEELSYPLDYGIRRLDHAVGNVPELGPSVSYVKSFTGFHEFAEFTAKDVGTSESGLNSVVLANNDEMVLLPLNEPVFGTKRKSQIQTYLEHNEGAGVQHLALVSEDIFRTLREMRQRSFVGGFEFMPSPPATYYKNLKHRAGDILSDEQIEECEELGILVDRDDQGTLLQIFTKPIGDRQVSLYQ